MNKNSRGRVSLVRALSKLGLASRTEAVALIQSGKVKVHGSVELRPERMINPDTAHIEVSAVKVVRPAPRLFAFHKPTGFLTTKKDPEGRPTIFDLLPADLQNFHAVGRLDRQTSGLLLLTNDTQISNYLTEPSNAIERVYEVTVRGDFSETDKAFCLQGFEDQGEKLKAQALTILTASKQQSSLMITLIQGKNREVRRICKRVEHEVITLHRIQYGDFKLGELSVRHCHELPISADLLKVSAYALHN